MRPTKKQPPIFENSKLRCKFTTQIMQRWVPQMPCATWMQETWSPSDGKNTEKCLMGKQARRTELPCFGGDWWWLMPDLLGVPCWESEKTLKRNTDYEEPSLKISHQVKQASSIAFVRCINFVSQFLSHQTPPLTHHQVVVSHIVHFHPEIWGADPNWRAYFNNGLVQPPTRSLTKHLKHRWPTPGD